MNCCLARYIKKSYLWETTTTTFYEMARVEGTYKAKSQEEPLREIHQHASVAVLAFLYHDQVTNHAERIRVGMCTFNVVGAHFHRVDLSLNFKHLTFLFLKQTRHGINAKALSLWPHAFLPWLITLFRNVQSPHGHGFLI